MKEQLAYASLLLSLAANIPYIYQTIKGKVKPERISWLIWTVLGATYYLSALFEGGATFFTFGELIGPGLILLVSIKFGVGGKSKFDKLSLLVASIALGLLFALDGVIVSLLLALLIDAIAGILTLRKLLVDPASEPRLAWFIGGVAASTLALFSLQNYSPETVLFPAYVLVFSTLIVFKANPSKK